MTLTKAHLTDSIRNGLGLPRSRSSAVVGSLFEIMKATLVRQEDILISVQIFFLKNKNTRVISFEI